MQRLVLKGSQQKLNKETLGLHTQILSAKEYTCKMPELNIIGAKEKNRYFPYQSAFWVTQKSFYQAGQDSFTAPPAQNPDMFQALTNVEPVLQGNLQRRRGYTLFSNTAPTVPFHEGYAFRSETLNLRRLVWTSSSTVVALDETGAVVSSPLFVPALAAGTGS